DGGTSGNVGRPSWPNALQVEKMLRITPELAKTERGPISMSGPSTFSMSPNRATLAEKSNRFSSLAAAQPLNILSRPETLNASGSRRLPDGHQPQCPFSH